MTDDIEAAIQRLSISKDSYFLNHPRAKLADRDKFLHDERAKLVSLVESQKTNLPKSQYYLRLGQIANVTDDYSPEADENLSKAIKLEPDMCEAWNQLGECYWKKSDFKHAENCFKQANTKNANKVSLRNLSMVMRQLPATDAKEKAETIRKSVDIARQALDFDPNDGRSLTIFGNACFTAFFAGAQRDSKVLGEALDAYRKALRSLAEENNADLHLNFGIALRYEEIYQESLDHLGQAAKLDPSLETAKERFENLRAFLKRSHEGYLKKAKLKPKRMEELLKKFHLESALGQLKFPCKVGETFTTLQPRQFTELRPALNLGCVIAGVVAGVIVNEETVPYTFCLLDAMKNALIVTLYNFVPDFGVVIGQTVAIPEPWLTEVSVKVDVDESQLKFPCVRVATPAILVINGQRVHPSAVAMCEAVPTNF